LIAGSSTGAAETPGSARRSADVLAALVRSDLRIRYGRGKVRVLKWLLDPIAALGIYLVLVAVVLDRSGTAAGLSLACAIVPFQLLITSVLNALQAVILRSSIIVNMGFPRTLIPLSSVATESVAVLASFTLLPLMMLVYGVAPTAAVLWVPVAFAVTVALAAALAYPAALIGVWYPEMVPFSVSLLRALFFIAPGIIALDAITGTARDLLPLNPFTGIFELFRHALLYGDSPPAWQVLVPLGFAAAILAICLPLYRREQRELAKLVG
jgi:lipopolysaccharide transport system permease protein